MASDLIQSALPIACSVAVGILLVLCAWRYFRVPDALGPPVAPTPLREALLRSVLWLLVSRALIYGIAALLCYIVQSSPALAVRFPVLAKLLPAITAVSNWDSKLDDFFRYPLNAWVRWDAHHYVGLAKNWYVNQGDPRFHIVFYPLYPLIVRIFSCFTPGLEAAVGFIVSGVCLLFSGAALLLLVEHSHGVPAGRRALRYLMLGPLSLFFSVPYSESLFLMLTLLCVLMARKRKLGWAILFGALASATRLLGLLCAVPVFYAFLCDARKRESGKARFIACGALLCCLIALGFAAYLLLNWQVTGDPLKFLEYQKDHWGQTFGSIHKTLSYTLEYAFAGNWSSRLGTWLPQLVCMPLTLVLMGFTWKRLNPGDGAYAILYFLFALSPTWLLSGPRYLTGMYALYPMLALVTRRRWQDWALTAGLLLGTVYGVFMYAIVGALF